MKIKTMTLLVLAMSLNVAYAQTGPELMMIPLGEGQQADVQVQAAFQGKGDIDGTSTGIQLQTYDAAGRWRVSDDDLQLTFGAAIKAVNINSTSTLLPNALVDQSVALGARVGEFQGWTVDVVAGLGYNGDSPYADGNAWYGKADLIFTTELDEKSILQLLVDYNGNRTFFPDLPLPAFAYTHQYSDQLTYTLGFPTNSITWTPDDRWTWQLDYAVPFTADVRVGYEVNETVELFGKFANRLDAYRLNNNDSDRRRVLFTQRLLEAGIVWTPAGQVQLAVAGGYAFSQEFDRGFDVRETRSILDASDEPYVSVQLNVSF